MSDFPGPLGEATGWRGLDHAVVELLADLHAKADEAGIDISGYRIETTQELVGHRVLITAHLVPREPTVTDG